MSRRRGRSAFPFLEALPLQFGDFLDQLLQGVIVVDGLADALLPRLGDTQLAEFTLFNQEVVAESLDQGT